MGIIKSPLLEIFMTVEGFSAGTTEFTAEYFSQLPAIIYIPVEVSGGQGRQRWEALGLRFFDYITCNCWVIFCQWSKLTTDKRARHVYIWLLHTELDAIKFKNKL